MNKLTRICTPLSRFLCLPVSLSLSHLLHPIFLLSVFESLLNTFAIYYKQIGSP